MSTTTLDVLASIIGAQVPANCSNGEVDTQSTNWRTTSSEDVNVHDTTVACVNPSHPLGSTRAKETGSTVATADRDSSAQRASASD